MAARHALDHGGRKPQTHPGFKGARLRCQSKGLGWGGQRVTVVRGLVEFICFCCLFEKGPGPGAKADLGFPAALPKPHV